MQVKKKNQIVLKKINNIHDTTTTVYDYLKLGWHFNAVHLPKCNVFV